ncbi:MAG: GMP reductase [Firmicutes bacterium]|nr:GMP reductase [Bacillota bacterium]MCL1953933.1 GMP reductase [Bacillota bacterium]
MIIENDVKLDFSDVLLKPKRSTLVSRKDFVLSRVFKTKWSQRTFECVPIIAANMATGTFKMANVFSKYNMLVAINKFYSINEWIAQDATTIANCIYTIGMSDLEYERYLQVLDVLFALGKIKSKQDLHLCIDIANGYTKRYSDFVKKIRDANPSTVIIAGNVCTAELVQELILAGADFVKVGIGPGSACTTRQKTGVGYPQLSACIECGDAAHGLDAGIVLDGGMRSPGDIAKAFAANADFVMLGGMLSGTDETDGDIEERIVQTNIIKRSHDGQIIGLQEEIQKHKIWYGMSSEYAQQKYMMGMKDYRTSEGRREEVPYVGPVQPIVDDILGGLRSAGTYIGATGIKQFGKCATFLRVMRQHDRF